MSDGVHDNLEPLQIGLSPLQVAYPEDVPWESIDPQRRAEIATSYSIFLLNNLLAAEQNGTPANPLFSDLHPEWKDWTVPPLEIFSEEVDPNHEVVAAADISCYKIVQRLINHCLATNRNAAVFMQDNPTKKLPKDYKLYPGKMDHTTCMALRVRKNKDLEEQHLKESAETKSSGVKKKRVTRKLSTSVGASLVSPERTRHKTVIYPSLEETTWDDEDVPHFQTKRTSSSESRKAKAAKSKKTLQPTLRRSRSLESIPFVAFKKKEGKKQNKVANPLPEAL